MTEKQTLGYVLQLASPANIADALRKLNLGEFIRKLQNPVTENIEIGYSDVLDLSQSANAILSVVVTEADNGDAVGSYIVVPAPAALKNIDDTGWFGSCHFDGNKTLVFKTGSAISKLTVTYLAKPTEADLEALFTDHSNGL